MRQRQQGHGRQFPQTFLFNIVFKLGLLCPSRFFNFATARQYHQTSCIENTPEKSIKVLALKTQQKSRPLVFTRLTAETTAETTAKNTANYHQTSCNENRKYHKISCAKHITRFLLLVKKIVKTQTNKTLFAKIHFSNIQLLLQMFEAN